MVLYDNNFITTVVCDAPKFIIMIYYYFTSNFAFCGYMYIYTNIVTKMIVIKFWDQINKLFYNHVTVCFTIYKFTLNFVPIKLFIYILLPKNLKE